jgi:small GTP-binding protein
MTRDGTKAVSVAEDDIVQVWNLPPDPVKQTASAAITRYTNAKVLLVGESGVGKTGLAIRLTQDRFEPTFSSDGVWATQMQLPHGMEEQEIEREIWLWDFAGQADYRLIHQLFMDETALAVLVFNPQSEDPFEGLVHWDRDLTRAARRAFRKLLVAGRCDRGGLMVSFQTIERFRVERGFAEYLETSARTGIGCQRLRELIVENIAWKEIPWTASPRIFKLLKEAILKLKDEGKVLLRTGELKQQLEMRLPGEPFSLEQLRAVIGLLAGPGIVWQLEFGDFVLLQAECINAYAAAVIRAVRAHTDEIGCIPEERVLTGKIDYQDMKRLPEHEEQIVLRAMHQIFVKHGLCLREPTDAGPLLIFPSYFKRERPELEGHPVIVVTYRFSGPLEEIYASLVVRLHHTPTFDNDQLWRFAADFKTPEGKRLGFKMTKKTDGSADLAVYCDPAIPDDTKVTFIRYIHDHVKTKDPNAIRLRQYVCPHCHTPVENVKAVQRRIDLGASDIVCVGCEKRVLFFDLIEQKFSSDKLQKQVREMADLANSKIDNESRELILLGHAIAIAGEAGQIFRPTSNSDWGIDGEIEFKDYEGKASGQRVYLQLKSGDSYLRQREKDGSEVFEIKNIRHARYWQQHAYPVMLVIRTSDGRIRWMNVSSYLREQEHRTKKLPKLIAFDGQPFTALNLQRLRDELIVPSDKKKFATSDDIRP